MPRFRTPALLVIALTGLAGPASAQISGPAPQYLITDVGALGGTGQSRAYGISPNGQFVTGLMSVGGGNFRAFRHQVGSGTLADLGTVAGTTSSVGFGANNAGAVTGYSTNANLAGTFDFNASDRAFIATGATATGIPVLAGGGFSGQGYNAARGQSINASNELVGYAFNLNTGDFQGFRSAGGAAPTALNFLTAGGGFGAGTLGLAFGINAAGQVSGESDRDNPAGTNRSFAVRYAAGSATPTALPPAPGFDSAHGSAINGSGFVAGFAENIDTGPVRGYFSTGGSSQALGVLTGGSASFANALNDSHQVVGQSDATGGVLRAVAYDTAGNPIDLNTRLTGPGAAGWTLLSAEGISNDGFIVGFGTIGGNTHAFLLTPVPEPGSFVLAGVGLAGLAGARRWRRRTV